MRIIVFEAEVAVLEVKNIFFVGIDYHFRQRTWLACELEPGLLKVIEIKMCVAESVGEYVFKNSGVKPYNVDGENVGDWVIMDYGDTWVHIFLPETRVRYNLEELWSDAPVSHVADLD